MVEHLGYDQHDLVGSGPGQLSQRHPLEGGADRRPAGGDRRAAGDRDGTLTVHKRQRVLDDIDQIMLPLTARGLTTEKINAHRGPRRRMSKYTISP